VPLSKLERRKDHRFGDVDDSVLPPQAGGGGDGVAAGSNRPRPEEVLLAEHPRPRAELPGVVGDPNKQDRHPLDETERDLRAEAVQLGVDLRRDRTVRVQAGIDGERGAGGDGQRGGGVRAVHPSAAPQRAADGRAEPLPPAVVPRAAMPRAGLKAEGGLGGERGHAEEASGRRQGEVEGVQEPVGSEGRRS
jgi:hypothetical protein